MSLVLIQFRRALHIIHECMYYVLLFAVSGKEGWKSCIFHAPGTHLPYELILAPHARPPAARGVEDDAEPVPLAVVKLTLVAVAVCEKVLASPGELQLFENYMNLTLEPSA